jgi:hypothetical protein
VSAKEQTWIVADIGSELGTQMVNQVDLTISRFEIPTADLSISRPRNNLKISWGEGVFSVNGLADGSTLLSKVAKTGRQPTNMAKKLGLILSFYRTDMLLIAIYDHITSYHMWLDILGSHQSYFFQGFTRSASLSLN